MNRDKQPEALRLVEWFEKGSGFQQGTKAPHKWVLQAEQELRRLHAESELHQQELASYRFTVENREARIAELEVQLAAAQQGVQPMAWLAEYVDREGNSKWYVSTHKDLATENDMHGAPKPLYTHPTPQGLDARQWLQQHDFEALERFAETSEDDESYDIGKEAIQRLTHFGCLNSHGFGRYSITAFGSYVLDNWSLARELPFKMQSERDAEHRAALAAQAKQGDQQ